MTEIRKLARSQMAAWKQRQIGLQGGRCPVSGVIFDMHNLKDAVIDHDHVTGQIRGVLTRSANAVEGKVKSAVARWGGCGEDYSKIIPYLERLLVYLKGEPLPYIYPTHETPEEKAAKARQKARVKQAARRATQRTRTAS